MTTRHIITLIALAALLAATTACSTTSRLGEGEVLYTGVKKLRYTMANDSLKLDSDVKDQIFQTINVKPNNPLYSPYYRTPFPVGLWVYNHMDPQAKGFKGWFYRTFVSRPVLISRVKPDTRVEMIDQVLRNNGYFSSSADYTLNYNEKNPKKASITYDVKVGKPHVLGNIQLPVDDSPVDHIIDSVARRQSYLKPGNRYCLDSLNDVRINITNTLRNRGYYYFRPEYIEYIADSVTTPGTINLKMIMTGNVPNNALQRYLIHDVSVTVMNEQDAAIDLRHAHVDTVQLRNCTLYKVQPVNISDKLIESCIRGRQGRAFRVGMMDRTQLYLSRTGIFSTVNMQVEPLDTVLPDGDRMLDLNILCILDKPLELRFEVQGTSKSNSYLGPGLSFTIKDKNLSGGGEQLSAKITAAYEWQTGKQQNHSGNLNSYEFGAKFEFAIPRLLAPRFVDRSRRYLNWTRMSISADLLNRPRFFKLAQAGAEFQWEWHSNKHTLNVFTPFKLTYSKLLSTTAKFDSIRAEKPAIGTSFEDQFIPMMSYSHTYDNTWGPNTLTWSFTVMEAGNVCSGLWALAGKKNHEKQLFGTLFAQFVKAQTSVVWARKLAYGQVVGRMLVGVAKAYGNSSVVPYREQFYAGGANSLRGFAVRTVGPGSYKPDSGGFESYYDQTGDLRFETNWEYRFPIFGYFNGAVFVDAGNVWSLEEEDWRPGSRIGNFMKELAVDAGLGLRFDMSMLVLRADVGFALHAPYDTGNRGYFNVPFKKSYMLHLAIGYPF